MPRRSTTTWEDGEARRGLGTELAVEDRWKCGVP